MSLVLKVDRTDVLTGVLSTLGIRGQVFCCSELSAPWSMALPASGLAHFHVLEQGSAWLQLAGESTAVPLASGALVLLPHGGGHMLCDSLETPPVLLEHLLAQSQGGPPRIAQDGGSAETRLRGSRRRRSAMKQSCSVTQATERITHDDDCQRQPRGHAD
jgi:Cupin